MKAKLCTIILIFAVLVEVQAQNHFWTIPNSAVLFSDPPEQVLQLPISPNGYPSYEGLPAENAHNGIALPNGEMLFFAVDNQVLYPDGEYMCTFNDAGGNNRVSGNSEICIVPDPRYCGDRYYMFMSNSGSDNSFRYPFCAQIDLTYPSLSGSSSYTGAPVNDGFDSSSIPDDANPSTDNTIGWMIL